jgi:hypothetical protein
VKRKGQGAKKKINLAPKKKTEMTEIKANSILDGILGTSNHADYVAQTYLCIQVGKSNPRPMNLNVYSTPVEFCDTPCWIRDFQLCPIYFIPDQLPSEQLFTGAVILLPMSLAENAYLLNADHRTTLQNLGFTCGLTHSTEWKSIILARKQWLECLERKKRYLKSYDPYKEWVLLNKVKQVQVKMQPKQRALNFLNSLDYDTNPFHYSSQSQRNSIHEKSRVEYDETSIPICPRSSSPTYRPTSPVFSGSTSPVYRPTSPVYSGSTSPTCPRSSSPIYRPTSPVYCGSTLPACPRPSSSLSDTEWSKKDFSHLEIGDVVHRHLIKGDSVPYSSTSSSSIKESTRTFPYSSCSSSSSSSSSSSASFSHSLTPCPIFSSQHTSRELNPTFPCSSQTTTWSYTSLFELDDASTRTLPSPAKEAEQAMIQAAILASLKPQIEIKKSDFSTFQVEYTKEMEQLGRENHLRARAEQELQSLLKLRRKEMENYLTADARSWANEHQETLPMMNEEAQLKSISTAFQEDLQEKLKYNSFFPKPFYLLTEPITMDQIFAYLLDDKTQLIDVSFLTKDVFFLSKLEQANSEIQRFKARYSNDSACHIASTTRSTSTSITTTISTTSFHPVTSSICVPSIITNPSKEARSTIYANFFNPRH